MWNQANTLQIYSFSYNANRLRFSLNNQPTKYLPSYAPRVMESAIKFINGETYNARNYPLIRKVSFEEKLEREYQLQEMELLLTELELFIT